MSDRKLDDLVTRAVKKSVPMHAGYKQAGTHDRPGIVLPKEFERRVVRHVARTFTPSLLARRPPRALMIQGEPGIGKTEGVLVTLSRWLVDSVLVDVTAELAGEAEGAPVVGFKRLEAFIKSITGETGGAIALVFDDFELTAGRESHVETTINQQLLVGSWQRLLDGRGMEASYGVPVPFICTGNSFDTMRASAIRVGRCEIFTHTISLPEKTAMVAALMPLVAEKSVRALVKAHANRPIAFFHDLHQRVMDEGLDALIDQHGLAFSALDRAVRNVEATSLGEPDVLMRKADELAAEQVDRFV